MLPNRVLGAWVVDSWESLILRNYSLLSDSDSNEWDLRFALVS